MVDLLYVERTVTATSQQWSTAVGCDLSGRSRDVTLTFHKLWTSLYRHHSLDTCTKHWLGRNLTKVAVLVSFATLPFREQKPRLDMCSKHWLTSKLCLNFQTVNIFVWFLRNLWLLGFCRLWRKRESANRRWNSKILLIYDERLMENMPLKRTFAFHPWRDVDVS